MIGRLRRNEPDAPVEPGRRRRLVYTSAGDRACLDRWLVGRRTFDLWVTWYGDGPGRHRDVADAWWARKGSKFQNLHHLWRTDPACLAAYDAVMVLDDDIGIDAEGISRLFDLREAYDLSVLQPAFAPPSKISHPVTRRRSDCKMRFTRFVEMNCPLFRRSSLEAFLAEYDPELVGYGIDHWYMNVLSREARFRCAVVDSVSCVNPPDEQKGGVREIDRLLSEDGRRAQWERIRTRRGLTEMDTGRVEGRVRRPLVRRMGERLRAWRAVSLDGGWRTASRSCVVRPGVSSSAEARGRAPR